MNDIERSVDDLVMIAKSYVSEHESLDDILSSEWMEKEVEKIARKHNVSVKQVNEMVGVFVSLNR